MQTFLLIDTNSKRLIVKADYMIVNGDGIKLYNNCSGSINDTLIASVPLSWGCFNETCLQERLCAMKDELTNSQNKPGSYQTDTIIDKKH